MTGRSALTPARASRARLVNRLLTHRSFRPIELGRAGWGAALLFVPRPVLEQVPHLRVDAKSVAIARILGARQLSQAALSGIRPSPEVLAMGVWVDTAHAVTALALALTDRSRARAGLTDMAVAGVWAGLGYRDIGAGHLPPAVHERRRDRLARAVLSIAPGGRPLLRRADEARRSQHPAR